MNKYTQKKKNFCSFLESRLYLIPDSRVERTPYRVKIVPFFNLHFHHFFLIHGKSWEKLH